MVPEVHLISTSVRLANAPGRGTYVVVVESVAGLASQYVRDVCDPDTNLISGWLLLGLAPAVIFTAAVGPIQNLLPVTVTREPAEKSAARMTPVTSGVTRLLT
jgi:hypothetical protein